MKCDDLAGHGGALRRALTWRAEMQAFRSTDCAANHARAQRIRLHALMAAPKRRASKPASTSPSILLSAGWLKCRRVAAPRMVAASLKATNVLF